MSSAFLRNVLALACAALVLAGCNRPAHTIEEAMVAGGDEWPSWGRTGHETHYSPLDEIDAGNVADLKLAWHFDLEPGFTPTTPLLSVLAYRYASEGFTQFANAITVVILVISIAATLLANQLQAKSQPWLKS